MWTRFLQPWKVARSNTGRNHRISRSISSSVLPGPASSSRRHVVNDAKQHNRIRPRTESFHSTATPHFVSSTSPILLSSSSASSPSSSSSPSERIVAAAVHSSKTHRIRVSQHFPADHCRAEYELSRHPHRHSNQRSRGAFDWELNETLVDHASQDKHAVESERLHLLQDDLEQRLPQAWQRFAPLLARIMKHLLPQRYPLSVNKHYIKYCQYQALSSISSSAIGVLSTQALLFAIGLGASTAIPAAAALNWVIKDGLGQLGGVIFTSFTSNKFDLDPKRWKMVAALSMDAASLLEIITPLFPAYFLPLASIANIGKNVSWLTASATKAGIHKSFLKAENLGDVTAKAGSQSITASLIGTGFGIGLSAIIGAELTAIVPAFTVLAVIHLYYSYRAADEVALPTFNQQRAERVMLGYIDRTVKGVQSGAIQSASNALVPTRDHVRALEVFIRPYVSTLDASSNLIVGASLSFCFGDLPHRLPLALTHFESQQHVLELRPLERSSKDDENEVPTVFLLFHRDATSKDVLRGYLHAVKLRLELLNIDIHRAHQSDLDELMASTLKWTNQHFDAFLEACIEEDWTVAHTYLEEGAMNRIQVQH
jgi:Vitamin B6 photo-protection and homoeostasis